MCKPRTTTLLFAAILVAVSFKGQAWLAAKTKEAAISPAAVESTLTLAAPVKRAAAISEKPAVISAKASTSTFAAISTTAKPLQLSSDATALLAEMCDLQLLAHGTGLNLNSRQWSAFASVVLRNQAIRQTYEAEIATSKVVAPGQYRVEIPAYADVGDGLRGKFITDLRTALGETVAVNVLTELGDRLEARFAGFGVSMQTLDITGNPQGTLADIQITRTVTYWNSVDGNDRPTTRREIHFPASEDPTGDSWSALLAMVKA